MSYLPCELHCYTNHSNGVHTTKELLQSAINDHLALISITDKNTTKAWDETDDSIIPTIKGIELNTTFGNVLALGSKAEIDWNSDNKPVEQKLMMARASKGAVGVTDIKLSNFDWDKIDFIEIWSKEFSFENEYNEKSFAVWTELLDKGYHIPCTYGKHWAGNESKENHYGCTYLDIDGDVNEENAIEAIKLGKTVASTGAKFFFRVHQRGNTYSIGDTIKRGLSIFSFFTDLHSRAKNAGEEEIEYKTIKVITNEGHCVMETSISERHVRIDLKKKHWYRAELWGTVNGESKILAVTSPIYTA